MEKKWNINSFLCESADEKVTNIKNIFDTLRIKKDGTASFTIVTMLNAFKCDESSFRLYYFMEQLDKDQMAYLGNSYFERDSSKSLSSSRPKSSGCVESAVSMMIRVDVKGVNFPSTGQYELQVYKYDNTDAENIDDKSPEEQGKWAEQQHLVATYPFNVYISEE